MSRYHQGRGRDSSSEDEPEFSDPTYKWQWWEARQRDNPWMIRCLLRFMIALIDSDHHSLRGDFLRHNLDPKNRAVPEEIRRIHAQLMNTIEEILSNLKNFGLSGHERWDKVTILNHYMELGGLMDDSCLLAIRDKKDSDSANALVELRERLEEFYKELKDISKSISKANK